MKIKYEEYDMDMLEIIYQWYQCAIKTNRPIPEKILKLVTYYKEQLINKENKGTLTQIYNLAEAIKFCCEASPSYNLIRIYAGEIIEILNKENL